MDIKVYYKDKCTDDDNFFPKPIRALLVGGSGCGKTNVLMNLIYDKDGLTFKNLYVFSRSIEQPAYNQLREHYKRIEQTLGESIAFFISTCEDIPPLDQCEKNSLVVFDDCLLENQTTIKDYFIRGRHKQISCIYLTQSYSRIDVQVIRNNVNMLFIFHQNNYYTTKIYNDFVGSDMSLESFKAFCKKCWDKPFGFITINTTRKSNNGKYRCMLYHEPFKIKSCEE